MGYDEEKVLPAEEAFTEGELDGMNQAPHEPVEED